MSYIFKMDLSVIIINSSTEDYLRACLRSVFTTVKGLDFEVIVVDNASNDGSMAMMKVEFPHIRRIENYENRGFAVAGNQGFRVMKGRYALLLHADTVLTEGAVRELFMFMDEHPEAVIACGQLLDADGTKQTSFERFPAFSALLMDRSPQEPLFSPRRPDPGGASPLPIEVDACAGACLIVRKSAIDGVGGLDERYGYHYAIMDWARTMKRAGGIRYCVPVARIHHHRGRSRRGGIRYRMQEFRSRYLYIMKWESSVYFTLAAVVIVIRLILRWVFTGAGVALSLGLNRPLRDTWAVNTKLLAWHLRGCP